MNNIKSRKKYLEVGNKDNVQCCMCEQIVNKNNTLIPSGCLRENGKAAHRICQSCWWNPESGFAREGISHKCPGCIKNIPLTPYQKKQPITIDLTDD